MDRSVLKTLRHEWRSWAWVLCILSVHFAGLGHRAFERHVLCDDHGEWVHEELCADEHSQAPEESEAPEDHEHCLLVSMARLDSGPTPPEPVCLPQRLTCTRAVQAPSSSTARVSVPLLLLAPKQSPPAA
jgi:hypothetical protein